MLATPARPLLPSLPTSKVVQQSRDELICADVPYDISCDSHKLPQTAATFSGVTLRVGSLDQFRRPSGLGDGSAPTSFVANTSTAPTRVSLSEPFKCSSDDREFRSVDARTLSAGRASPIVPTSRLQPDAAVASDVTPDVREPSLIPAPSPSALAELLEASTASATAWEALRWAHVDRAFVKAGVLLPTSREPKEIITNNGPQFLLSTSMIAAVSEFVRRTRMPLHEFVELWRYQTPTDYRPNKSIDPTQIVPLCSAYPHLQHLLRTAAEGVRLVARSTVDMTRRPAIRSNHGSASRRLNVLIKNLRKEQDAGRCLVVNIDVLQIWDDVVVSPFGVVDKSDGDPAITGRTIHDLSFPEALSINDLTDTSMTPAPSYMPCSAVVKEIIRTKDCNGSSVPTLLLGGDVASAFRHLSVHSQSVKFFGGVIPELQVLVLDLCAPFGWTLSPAEYDVFGGAISHIHGSTFDRFAPDGFFRYHWVDDHVNVSRDNPGHCDAVERSIRRAMTVVLGPAAINEEKFTSWQARLKVLGLLFDADAMTVAMPPAKIAKAARIVRDTQMRSSLSRSEFRSLLGSLRHVATCIRPARAFLQRLRAAERCDQRQHRVPITAAITADLQWWAMILEHKSLNGVPMSFFSDCPAPDVTVSVDASNYGLCAADHSSRFLLTYQFTSRECLLILDLLNGRKNGFDINYRELLSLAFAVHAWGSRWARPPSFPPTHVRFLIDNTSAVSWQTRLSSPNLRAQNIIRLLALWEVRYNLRCSSIHLPGRDNTLADLGSRIAQSTGNANRFRDLTQSWHITQVPDDSSFFDQLWLNISESVPSPSQH